MSNATATEPTISRADFKAFESNLYNAQSCSELAALCNSPETAKEAKALFCAIHETRNKLIELMRKLK